MLGIITLEGFDRNSAVINGRLTGNNVSSDPVRHQMTVAGYSIADGGAKYNRSLMSLNGIFGKVYYRQGALQITTQNVQIARTKVRTKGRVGNWNLRRKLYRYKTRIGQVPILDQICNRAVIAPGVYRNLVPIEHRSEIMIGAGKIRRTPRRSS